MHDTLDERLAQLGGSLEDTIGVKSPTAVRSRGEQIRVAHRRRVMAATATSAAVAIVGVAGFVALQPGGGHRGGTVGPGQAGSTPTVSSPFQTPPANGTSASKGAGSVETTGTPDTTGTTGAPGTTNTGSAKAAAVVDLKQDTMTVRDKSGQVVKTLPVTAGASAHPTQVGTYTVVDKKPQQVLTSPPAGPTGNDTYNVTVDWVIELSGGGPSIYAAPWASSSLGVRNTTHGDIGLSNESAEWLYNYVSVGDRIQIQ